MTHLDEGQILTLRDDPEALGAHAAAHLHGCPACRGALEDVRLQGARVAGALASLDDTGWSMDAARERVRLRVAAESARASGGVSLPARRARGAAGSVSQAAGLRLVTAAGLSALPGSPVRRWIEELVSPAPVEVAPAVAPAAIEAEDAPAPEEAGVRLPVARGPLAVLLRDVAPGTEIRVRWIPGAEAAVFAPVGSRFTSGDGRVEARTLSGVVRVELPRGVLPVSLDVDGRILLRNTASGLQVTGPVVAQDDAGITFRLPPG